MKSLKIGQYFLMLSFFIVGQAAERPMRELPAWMVYSYHYGVSPVTTVLALLARAGWFTTKTAAQGAWDTGKFIYNNPVGACLVIPANLFIAHALYQEGSTAWNYLRNMIHEPQPMEIEPVQAQTRKRKRNNELADEGSVVKRRHLN